MRRFLLAGLVLALGLSAGTPRPAARGSQLPSRLSDRDFWRLVVDSSERDGYFRSDNLTSNELLYQRVIPELLRRTRPGDVYLGVGPEQNFTYMAAVRPAFAVIFDIRRGNLLVQLMYKALFELATDRVEFVSMLFSKPRPRGVGVDSTVSEVFAAVGSMPSDAGLHARNLKAIRDQLTRTHGLPLVAADLDGIEYAYRAFYARGFAIRYQPTYDDLMIQTDGAGVVAQLPGVGGELRVPEGSRVAQSGGPGRRRLRRHQGDSLDRRVSQGARRDGGGLLSVQRRAVPESGRKVDGVLPERGDAAARQLEHLHSLLVRPRAGLWRGIRVEPRFHGGGIPGLWALAGRDVHAGRKINRPL